MLILGVLLSGSGSNLQAILDAIESGALDARVALVISNKAEAYGLTRARNAGIEALFVDPAQFESASSYNAFLGEKLTQAAVDYVVMAGYMKLLGTEVLDLFPDRVLNIHPSMLPAFAGANGIRDAFNAGVPETGVTVHIANEEFDQGEILEQVSVAIYEEDTLESLEERIHIIEHELYPRVLQRLAVLKTSTKGSIR